MHVFLNNFSLSNRGSPCHTGSRLTLNEGIAWSQYMSCTPSRLKGWNCSVHLRRRPGVPSAYNVGHHLTFSAETCSQGRAFGLTEANGEQCVTDGMRTTGSPRSRCPPRTPRWARPTSRSTPGSAHGAASEHSHLAQYKPTWCCIELSALHMVHAVHTRSLPRHGGAVCKAAPVTEHACSSHVACTQWPASSPRSHDGTVFLLSHIKLQKASMADAGQPAACRPGR